MEHQQQQFAAPPPGFNAPPPGYNQYGPTPGGPGYGAPGYGAAPPGYGYGVDPYAQRAMQVTQQSEANKAYKANKEIGKAEAKKMKAESKTAMKAEKKIAKESARGMDMTGAPLPGGVAPLSQTEIERYHQAMAARELHEKQMKAEQKAAKKIEKTTAKEDKKQNKKLGKIEGKQNKEMVKQGIYPPQQAGYPPQGYPAAYPAQGYPPQGYPGYTPGAPPVAGSNGWSTAPAAQQPAHQ